MPTILDSTAPKTGRGWGAKTPVTWPSGLESQGNALSALQRYSVPVPQLPALSAFRTITRSVC